MGSRIANYTASAEAPDKNLYLFLRRSKLYFMKRSNSVHNWKMCISTTFFINIDWLVD